jgi:hypothetical protein
LARMVARRVVIVALAATALGGCGSSSSSKSTPSAPSSPSATTVTLSIAGGTGNLNAVKCGKQEPFEHYAAPAQVKYSGTVTPAPSGRWKVKLKLKLCNGKSFVDAASQKIVGQTSGRFDGVFPVSKSGAYSLRATLEGGKRPQSDKQYLQVG